MWKRRHLEESLVRKERNSGYGSYLVNQMKWSAAEFLIRKPIVSCEYFLAVPDRNPVAGVIEKSACDFSENQKLFSFFSAWNSCYSFTNFQSETNSFPFWHLKRLLRWSAKLTIFAAESMSGKTSGGICVQLIILPCQVTDPPNESTPKTDIWEAV